MRNKKVLGYCSECRAYEIKHYGTVLNTAGPRHVKACKEAKCHHPAWYNFPNKKAEPNDTSS
jgi:hypothetical protein